MNVNHERRRLFRLDEIKVNGVTLVFPHLRARPIQGGTGRGEREGGNGDRPMLSSVSGFPLKELSADLPVLSLK
jgi:hypothetical protein|tara:strand:+ start:1400 stop:1621 length:222 start_codon:yes stop_codon:yes gene_type:complete